MTIPQFNDTPTENLGGGDKRDPSEYVPWDRIAEVVTPRGNRPGCVMIVRPLERIKDFRSKDPEDDWKTLVVADIAILDAIPSTPDQFGIMLPPIPGGSQWRNQTVFPGMLNKAWRDKIGGTLIGVIYYGQPKPTAQGTMGKPPFLWRSLSQDANQVRRGQGFMAARPEFLIPVPRVNPAPVASGSDAWGQQMTPAAPAPVVQEPWAHLGPAPTYAPQPTQPAYAPQEQWQQVPGAAMNQVLQPLAPATPVYQPQPVQAAPVPASAPPAPQGYQQPDPWAQGPAQAVAPAQTQHPNQGMTTLQQIQQAAAQVNHQGQPQNGEPPF
jgi:hypothetical protein